MILSAQVMPYETLYSTPVEQVLPSPNSANTYSVPIPNPPTFNTPQNYAITEVHEVPDFFIVGAQTDEENETKNEQIVDWLSNFDFKTEVSGLVEFELNEGENEATIRGEKLQFSTGDREQLLFTGEQGIVRVKTKHGKPVKFEFDFQGDTDAKIYGAEISADAGRCRIEILDNTDEISTWQFTGNVKVVVDGVTMKCQTLRYIERDGRAEFKLDGNARLTRDQDAGDTLTISGDRVRWDVTNGRFESSSDAFDNPEVRRFR